ncbi:MAG: histone deacetylase [Chloroflexota bacterium]
MKVGLVHDPVYLQHDTGAHPENAQRLVATIALLEKSGVKDKLLSLRPRQALRGEILLNHTAKHVARVRDTAARGGGWLDPDTAMSADSYDVALYAAGGVLLGVEKVMAGELDSCFALVRPPGHHATPDGGMGFCLFNNVAIAARFALASYDIARVLIVDFDVHHGNGTQDAFHSDGRVLYLSTHQYPFYPGSGDFRDRGTGPGEGKIVNVPLPAGCGDEEFLRVYREILVPVARRFEPELVLVSAGYDAHWSESIASMRLTVTGYAGIVRVIKDLAGEICPGRLVFALEGGYHLQALPASVRATLDVLLGSPGIDDPLGPPPEQWKPAGFEDLLRQVKRLHRLE